MKCRITLLPILLFLLQLKALAAVPVEDSIVRIKIKAFHMMSRTEYDIPCDDLLQDGYDSFLIEDRTRINKILGFLGNSTFDTGGKPCNLDTRARMTILYQSGKVDLICIGTVEMFCVNGVPKTFRNWEMMWFIQSLLESVKKKDW